MQKACPGGWSISSTAPSATVSRVTTSKPKLIAWGSTCESEPMLRRTFVTRLKRSTAARSSMMSRMPWHSDISCTGALLYEDTTRHARVERRDQQVNAAAQIVAGGQADEAADDSALWMEVPLVR